MYFTPHVQGILRERKNRIVYRVRVNDLAYSTCIMISSYMFMKYVYP